MGNCCATETEALTLNEREGIATMYADAALANRMRYGNIIGLGESLVLRSLPRRMDICWTHAKDFEKNQFHEWFWTRKYYQMKHRVVVPERWVSALIAVNLDVATTDELIPDKNTFIMSYPDVDPSQTTKKEAEFFELVATIPVCTIGRILPNGTGSLEDFGIFPMREEYIEGYRRLGREITEARKQYLRQVCDAHGVYQDLQNLIIKYLY